MIALCLQHHKEADSGAFSHQQLREFKRDPYLKRSAVAIGGHFNWKREQLILQAGGGLYVRTPVFLEIAGRPVIWLTSDANGNQLLNLDLWDAAGNLAFAMRDNDWVAIRGLEDVEAPPSARALVVRAPARELRLSIEFSATTTAALRTKLRQREQDLAQHLAEQYKSELSRLREEKAPASFLEGYERMIEETTLGIDRRVEEVAGWVEAGWSRPELVTCAIEARMPFPVPVQITSSRIVLPGDTVLTGSTAVDCGTAIALG